MYSISSLLFSTVCSVPTRSKRVGLRSLGCGHCHRHHPTSRCCSILGCSNHHSKTPDHDPSPSLKTMGLPRDCPRDQLDQAALPAGPSPPSGLTPSSSPSGVSATSQLLVSSTSTSEAAATDALLPWPPPPLPVSPLPRPLPAELLDAMALSPRAPRIEASQSSATNWRNTGD